MSSAPASFQHALKWSYAMSWGEQAVTTIVTFVLAAYLGPSAFGIMAMALAYVMFIQLVLDQGLGIAVVQRERITPSHLDSVFWAVMCASVLLVGVSVALSGWWAHATRLPQLSGVITALSVTIPIRGLTVVQKAILQRNLQFKELAIRANLAVLVGGVVGIGLALGGYGVWALVWQRVANDVTSLIVLWSVGRWRPGFNVSLVSLRELSGCSGATFLASLGVWVQTHADAFLMGTLLGPLPLGIYRFSFRLVQIVVQLTTSPLRAVSLAHLSRHQSDAAKFSGAVLESVRLSALSATPLLAILAVSSDSLVEVMGPEWATATSVIRILSIFGGAMALAYFSAPILQASGRSHLLAVSMWVHGAVWCATLLVIGTWLRGTSTELQVLSASGARTGVALILSLPVMLMVVTRLGGVALNDLIRTMVPSAAAVTAAVATAPLASYIGMAVKAPAEVRLVLDVLVAFVSAAAALGLVDVRIRQNLRHLAGRATEYVSGSPPSRVRPADGGAELVTRRQ